ncbi:MAG: hypothetical protein JJU11_12200, partial [Candidatus Sumerlaeia bacterium]|nr:hypothetical protein [Candidatus Sumerlaeia bacterium]
MGHGLFHILGRSFPSSAAVVVAGLITIPAFLGANTPTPTPEPPSWSPTPTPTLTPTPDGALKILEV